MTARHTVGTALGEAARRLAAAGIENARAEARLLVCHALGVGPETLIADPERSVCRAERDGIDASVRRRSRREPMAYVLGRREFWGLTFGVSPDTLDPRPDSETVIEAALEFTADGAAELDILDLGTGCGCLVLSLLSELANSRGLGIDISAGAVAVARANARSLGLAARCRFEIGDWGADLTGPFEVIVANPPYIPAAEIDRLAPEIARFEPRQALDGGGDGLAAYREVAPAIARLLAPDGVAIVEIGADQEADVTKIAARSGLVPVAMRTDLAGRPRCLVLRIGPS